MYICLCTAPSCDDKWAQPHPQCDASSSPTGNHHHHEAATFRLLPATSLPLPTTPLMANSHRSHASTQTNTKQFIISAPGFFFVLLYQLTDIFIKYRLYIYYNNTTMPAGPTEQTRTMKPQASTHPHHCKQLLTWGRAGAKLMAMRGAGWQQGGEWPKRCHWRLLGPR